MADSPPRTRAWPITWSAISKAIWAPLNQVVHLWRYDDAAQRADIRAANYARPDWDAHLAKIRPLMAKQEATLLVPSPVSGDVPAC